MSQVAAAEESALKAALATDMAILDAQARANRDDMARMEERLAEVRNAFLLRQRRPAQHPSLWSPCFLACAIF
jgi:hypothetical protein